MDDLTRKRIERQRIAAIAAGTAPPAARCSPQAMQVIRDVATSELARDLLGRLDAGELDAPAFVEVLRAWLKRIC